MLCGVATSTVLRCCHHHHSAAVPQQQKLPGNPRKPTGWRNKLSNTYGILFEVAKKSKNSNKNQKLYTIVHLPARIDAIFKKIILTLKVASVRTHFRGGYGLKCRFYGNRVKPKKYAYPRSPTHPCWTKNGSETSIDPTILHHILHALFFYRKTLIPSPLGAQGGLKTRFC